MIDMLTGEQFYAVLSVSIIAAIGMNLVYITGQLNLGQAGFFGIGAYTVGWLDVELGWPLPLLLLGAAIVAGLVAVPIAVGVRRLSGIYLIMGTLAIGELVRVALSNVGFLGAREGFLTKSTIGLPALVVVALVVAVVAAGLMSSRVGLRMRSLFDDPDASAAAGVAVSRVRIFAVVISASVVGVAGGTWALWIQKFEPRDFDVFLSFDIALFSLIGGVHSLLGAIAGAAVVELLTSTGMFGLVGQWRFVVYGVSVMALIALLPEGIISRSVGLRATAPFRRRRREAGSSAGRPSGVAGEGVVLELRNVSHRYNGVEALAGVSLDVKAGEVLALIGANGAGKSTLIDVVSGRVASQEGGVFLDGRRIDGLSADRRTKLGVARTFQDVRPFAHLTVEESLRLASSARGSGDSGEVEDALVRFGLSARRDLLPAALTVAEQRRVEIARAVMSRPAVLLLDEPSVGMAEAERAGIAELIASFKDEGIAVVVVDHNLDLALGCADRAAVLDFGRLIAVGTPDEVLANPRVQAAYLGHADPAAMDGDGA